jgi:uncharacterized protein (DUF427 family)
MATRLSSVFPQEELRFEPSPRWVRGELGGVTVVDSKNTWIVWQPGHVVPGWCFPRADITDGVLRAVERGVYDVVAGGRTAERAAWTFDDPDLEGRVQIDFYKLDRWREEEEVVVGHPRDPFKRVDVRRSSRHVQVSVNGQVVADSVRPLMLFETGLPVRYYLPREDVRSDLLGPSDQHSLCAYKGEASYYDVAGAGDLAWFYPDPLADRTEIRDHVCFFNERVDIEVDGQPLERPQTKWSEPA